MIILVLNCGSSSIKYQVLDMKSDNEYSLLSKGLVERIGEAVGSITHKVPGKADCVEERPIADHSAGIDAVLSLLIDPEKGVLKSLADIEAVGHRTVHAGEFFSESTLATDETISKVERCNDLAPIHNPANIIGINAARALMPNVPQVMVFDTAFHQTIPDYAYIYALPYEYYRKYGVRRYGFHGSSHRFVSQKACDALDLDINKAKIITCHLGNGSSVTAVCNGKSVDTSMGLTPLEGLTMGTRCGNVDPGALIYIMQKEGLDAEGLNKVVNKKSGLLGISETSSDNRDIDTASAAGNRLATLAHDKLCYDIKKCIGSYMAAMNGADVIVMTGGIGENSRTVRRDALRDLEGIGIELDFDLNENIDGDNWIISKPTSKVKVIVCCTNEELVIARDTMRIALAK
ncbi:MAG: acetate kinase [Bacteroidales bacterium]|nr:acetate kinase [Bacteroidales bacterium]